MRKQSYISGLSGKLTAGQIDRRHFVMSALAAGITLPSALGLANSAMAATPKFGGRLRQGITGGATTDVLDPGQILDAYMINVLMGQVRNNLTSVAANGQLVGDLAESWEATPDAKTWHLNIRKGVEFHNGKTLGLPGNC